MRVNHVAGNFQLAVIGHEMVPTQDRWCKFAVVGQFLKSPYHLLHRFLKIESRVHYLQKSKIYNEYSDHFHQKMSRRFKVKFSKENVQASSTEEEKPSLKIEFYTPQDISDIDETWSIEKIVTERPPTGWKDLFESWTSGARHVDRILQQRGAFVPLPQEMFTAYHLCPLPKVKVIIIGQDPYHTVIDGLPQATGMSFSTRRDAPVQPSLRNVYAELAREYGNKFVNPGHGDLSSWARQGVLLLNTCLTTEPGRPGAHMLAHSPTNMWSGLIDKTFKLIRENRPNTVLMLWGSKAQKAIDQNMSKGLHILESAHPSPRTNGFVGNDHFKLANEFLEEHGVEPIDWCRFD